MSNNNFPTKEQVARLRQTYPAGTRVELNAPLKDPFSKLTTGDRGTVLDVFDNGDIGVKWDAGSSLHLIPDHDNFKIVPSMPNEVREEILKLRTLPDVPNMFDINAVQRLAFDNGMYLAVDWIENNRKAYSKFILTGETE